MKSLLLILISITSILTLPTPIRRNTNSPLCVPNTCILESGFCFCGREDTPNDPCCNFRCRTCPTDFILPGISFEIGPMSFFPLGLGTLNFTSIGRR
ncbi:unnamed protein product [Adineta steineri]|uniref:Uncharacterized protein n=2 Tax=Adineta steineri TaxID=433720 RepID=A0A814ZNK7_9BILA|nr:unnamed protein product [Adineta steineri]CAF4010360.1 unnamed protein product [Adineta steineri]